jgi:hypothetical protein
VEGGASAFMDHLPISPSCKEWAAVVPYLSLVPMYDRKGFKGFPERFGIAINDVHRSPILPTDESSVLHYEFHLRSEFVQSFLQEWLWFVALHEFETPCGIEMDPAQYIRLERFPVSSALDTSPPT